MRDIWETQSKSYLFIAYIILFYVILNLICRTRHIPSSTDFIRKRVYAWCAWSTIAAKAFTRLYIAMTVRKFFTDVLFHSAYNKLMLHPKMGKQRNHRRAVIYRWPLQRTDANSSAFYNYTHDDLSHPRCFYTVLPSTPRSADPLI